MSLPLWRTDAVVWLASWFVLGATWLGYPLVLALLARCRPFRPRRFAAGAPEAAWPSLSVIVCAHNEAEQIEARVRNLRAQDYPAGRVEILVSEDGSTDDTARRAQALAQTPTGMPLRVLSAAGRQGKAAALNRAAQAAAGEILVFTDANNSFAPGALRALVAPFADESVGAVTGRKRVAVATGVGGGESVYWRYEAWLTAQETATGGTAAAFGEALAVRRECFVPLPTVAMVNDDLYLGLEVLAKGKRVLSASEAESFEHGAADDTAEWERRRRMAVGHWAALGTLRGRWRRLGWAAAVKVGFHQVLRPASAVWLVLAGLSGLLLLAAPVEAVGSMLRGLASAQMAGAGLVAAVGAAHRLGARLGRAEAPYFFCLALAAALAGAWPFGRQREGPLWRRVARARATVPTPSQGRRLEPVEAPAIDNARILHELFWASSSFVLGKLLVFGAVMVLARLLAPQAFGAVALAVSTITVLEILGTLGLTSALIFEEREVDAAAEVCFWVTLATSAMETALAWALAPRLAVFFHEPALLAMLRALAACLVLMAAGNTHDMLLRRRLAFRLKLLPDLGQAAVKGTAAIALAVAGFGAWSLIWGQIAGTAVASVLLWWVTPWRPRMQWHAAVARRMAAYAKHIYLLDGSSVLLANLDTLTIGRMISDVALGFYNLAFRVPEVLLLSVINVITRVVFPAFSRLQEDRPRLREALLDTSRYTTLLTLPIAAGMALLAPELVYGIYGGHWGPSIPVLQVLALYAGLRCMTHHFGDAYKAIGRPDVLTRVTLAWWALLPPALVLGARWGGIVGVAWGQVATRAGMSVLHFYLVVRYIGVRPRQLAHCFAPALQATAVMSVALVALRPMAADWGPRPALLAMMAAGAAVYLLALAMLHPKMVLATWARLRQLPDTLVGGVPTPANEPAGTIAEPAVGLAPLAASPVATTAAEPRA